MPLRGADRITVDAFGADALAAPAFDMVIKAQQHRPLRRKGIQQQPEQHPGCGPPTPGGAVEHAMVVDEPPLPTEPGHPQDAGHRALPWNQDGADQQHLSMPPCELAKERGEA
jgi:hypothetical protein